jgi:hypothetical protein
MVYSLELVKTNRTIDPDIEIWFDVYKLNTFSPDLKTLVKRLKLALLCDGEDYPNQVEDDNTLFKHLGEGLVLLINYSKYYVFETQNPFNSELIIELPVYRKEIYDPELVVEKGKLINYDFKGYIKSLVENKKYLRESSSIGKRGPKKCSSKPAKTDSRKKVKK